MSTAFGWQRDKSVEEWLFHEPFRFEFVQAVRLLELLAGKDGEPLGSGSTPQREGVRLRSHVSQAFPASEVQSLRRPDGEKIPELTVNILGIAGAHGPLPPPYSELVTERIARGDMGMRDFLDIFNHRLLSLMYSMRVVHRMWLTNREPDKTIVGEYLYALIGLSAPSLRNRMNVPDRAMLFYAGLLSGGARSGVGLRQILAHYFGAPVDVQQFLGGWRPLEKKEWTAIGRGGRNHGLGTTAVLGFRMWDQQTRYGMKIGPLSLKQFRDFLPSGSAFSGLRDIARFYAGNDHEVRVTLGIMPADIPRAKLGQTQLGWTSWLSTRSPREDWQVQLRLNAAGAA
jgi:type VI secretion system protein ImpH